MRKYRCHKVVTAGKIVAAERNETTGGCFVTVLGGEQINVHPDILAKAGQAMDANIKDMGYLVVYDDGYTSWSPTKAFEEGYTEMLEPVPSAGAHPKGVEVPDLQNRFTYHPPQGDQVGRYEAIRSQAFDLANHVSINTPASREQSLALTKIEEAVFWANAAIARNE